jgi:hypothetical protein
MTMSVFFPQYGNTMAGQYVLQCADQGSKVRFNRMNQISGRHRMEGGAESHKNLYFDPSI